MTRQEALALHQQLAGRGFFHVKRSLLYMPTFILAIDIKGRWIRYIVSDYSRFHESLSYSVQKL